MSKFTNPACATFAMQGPLPSVPWMLSEPTVSLSSPNSKNLSQCHQKIAPRVTTPLTTLLCSVQTLPVLLASMVNQTTLQMLKCVVEIKTKQSTESHCSAPCPTVSSEDPIPKETARLGAFSMCETETITSDGTTTKNAGNTKTNRACKDSDTEERDFATDRQVDLCVEEE